MTPAILLSAMMALAEPGITPNSRVSLDAPATVAGCDEECQDSTVALYGDVPKLDYSAAGGRARWPGWSRQETRAEAIARWAVIARAIFAASTEPRWIGRRAHLMLLLVLLARAESANWRPIHEGRMRGRAGEWGLFQCMPNRPGCDETIVGLDIEATTRAARYAAKDLAASRRLTLRDCPAEDWVAATLRAYASGLGCAGALPDVEKRLRWWRTACGARLHPDAATAFEGIPEEHTRMWSRSPVPGRDGGVQE